MKKQHIIDKTDLYLDEKDISKLELIDPRINLLKDKPGLYAITTDQYLEKGLIKVGMSYNLRNRLLSYALYWPLSKIYLLACLIHSGKSNLGRGNRVFSLEQEIFSHFKEKLFYFPLRPSYTEWIRFEDLSDIKPEISAKFNQIHNRLKASTTLILNFDDASFNKEIANRVPRQLDIIDVLDYRKAKYKHPAQVLVKFNHLREDTWINLETVSKNRKVILFLNQNNPKKVTGLQEKWKLQDETRKGIESQVYKEWQESDERFKKQASERDARHKRISALLTNSMLRKSMSR